MSTTSFLVQADELRKALKHIRCSKADDVYLNLDGKTVWIESTTDRIASRFSLNGAVVDSGGEDGLRDCLSVSYSLLSGALKDVYGPVRVTICQDLEGPFVSLHVGIVTLRARSMFERVPPAGFFPLCQAYLAGITVRGLRLKTDTPIIEGRISCRDGTVGIAARDQIKWTSLNADVESYGELAELKTLWFSDLHLRIMALLESFEIRVTRQVTGNVNWITIISDDKAAEYVYALDDQATYYRR